MNGVTRDLVQAVLSVGEPTERLLRRRLLDVLLAPSQPARMTYEEFLDWADEDTLAEWVDGEVIMTSPASLPHQAIGMFLAQVLGLWVTAHGAGQVVAPPFQMKLETSGREPDLLYLANEHLGRLHKTYLDGPADLVVEIISPESASRDRGEKYYEYAQGGVPEYWLIDPQTNWAEFYRLQDNHYRLIFGGAEGEYRSQVLPGFWLQVAWLWQQPLPLVEEVLLEIGGEAYALHLIEKLRRRGFLE